MNRLKMEKFSFDVRATRTKLHLAHGMSSIPKKKKIVLFSLATVKFQRSLDSNVPLEKWLLTLLLNDVNWKIFIHLISVISSKFSVMHGDIALKYHIWFRAQSGRSIKSSENFPSALIHGIFSRRFSFILWVAELINRWMDSFMLCWQIQ